MSVFLERRKRHVEEYGGKRPANIIPVYWQSLTRKPRTIPEFQYTLSNSLKDVDKGVWDLLEEGKEARSGTTLLTR